MIFQKRHDCRQAIYDLSVLRVVTLSSFLLTPPPQHACIMAKIDPNCCDQNFYSGLLCLGQTSFNVFMHLRYLSFFMGVKIGEAKKCKLSEKSVD